MGMITNIKVLRAVDKFTDELQKENSMIQWIPSAVTLALTIAGLFNAQITGFIATHPTAGVAIGGIYAVIKGLMPSPLAVKK